MRKCLIALNTLTRSTASFQEYAVKIAPMHDRVWILEASPKRFAEIDMGDLLGGKRIHQAQCIDVDRHRTRGLAHAQIVEGVECIGPKLNPRADFAQSRRLFKHNNVAAFLREPKRGR